MKTAVEKRATFTYQSSYNNDRDRKHIQDPTVSSNGYTFDSSETRARIQQIEKELSETRSILYGKKNYMD